MDHRYANSTQDMDRRKRKPVTLASLFSGCGGLDLGLMGGFDFLSKHYPKTGFEVVWANDISPAACACYRAKLGDYILEGDIRDHMDSLPSTVDLVVGGFPCQDISINGKMLGLAGEKSSLYRYLVAAVERCQPKRFIAENVGGLLSKKHEGALAQILRDFASLGYGLLFCPLRPWKKRLSQPLRPCMT